MQSIAPRTTYDAHELAQIAARQYGVVTNAQLGTCGLTRGQINYLVRSGKLHRVYRHTYAVGHPGLSTKGRWMAAVLAAGPGAALAGLASARLHRIGRRRRVQIVVAVPKPRRPIPGVRLVVIGDMHGCDVECVDGIPTLSVSRTIVHAAPLVPVGELTKMISEAAHYRLLDLDRIAEFANDGSRRPGSQRVRDAVEAYVAGEHGTDSNLEDRVHVWLRDMASEPFRSNVHVRTPIELLRVDVLWEHIALVPEIDGPGHRRPDVRRRDADRTRQLAAVGLDVVRIDGELFDCNPIAALEHVREEVRRRELERGITYRWGD